MVGEIKNPNQTVLHNSNWENVRTHVQKVAAAFPKEYSVVQDDESPPRIVVLNIPITPEGKSITKDQLLIITPKYSDAGKEQVFIEITNEKGQIESYMELERDKRSLNIFTKLLVKSLNGTLGQSIARSRQSKTQQIDWGKAVLQMIIIAVAMIAFFFAMRVLIR